MAAARRELKKGSVGLAGSGSSDGKPAGSVQLTDAERTIAKRMGITEEELLKDKGRE